MPDDLTVAKGTIPGVNDDVTQVLTTDEAIAAVSVAPEELKEELITLGLSVTVGIDGARYTVPTHLPTHRPGYRGVYLYFTNGSKEYGDWAFERKDVVRVMTAALNAARRAAKE